MRKTHFSRLLDIVSGSAFAGAKTKVQKSALYRDFNVAALNDKRFREIITANLPIFYIVDLNTIAKEVANGLISDPKRFITKRLTSAGVVAPEEKDFSIKDLADQESTTYRNLLKDITDTCNQALSVIPAKSFEQVYTNVDNIYTRSIESFSKNNLSYIKYRNIAIKLGYDIRAYLSTVGIFQATDASRFVKIVANQKLIIGPTFDIVTRKINEILLKPLEDLLEDKYNIFVTKTNTGFKLGNLVNAGHTSAVKTSGEVIGINMPSAQELQFRLSGKPKSIEIERELGKLYYDTNYSIEFNQNYTEIGEKLLDMQFAFVITQPANFNTVYLRTEEQRRLKQLIKNEVLPSLEEQIKNKLRGGLINPEQTSASPNLIEYLESLTINTLKGVSTPSIKKKNSRSKNTKLEIPAVFNRTKSNKLSVNAKKGTFTKNLRITSNTVSGTNLLTLQNLLDNSLQERIRQNMGTGNRRDVLNYRTGRFAQSAKVERLSESRQGMITAFYSYMKNPYATFSQGGRQELPRSRDPKLLISKSIREIAGSLVANRLRAVNI